MLFLRHGKSIRNFYVKRSSDVATRHSHAIRTSRSIEHLHTSDLVEMPYNPLPARLIAQNLTRLKSLDLGHKLGCASAWGADVELQSASEACLDNFAVSLIVAGTGSQQSDVALSRLERLRLTGFDANEVAEGGLGVWIHFEHLKVLSLESCFKVEQALRNIVYRNRSQKSTVTLLQLTDLTIRHEDATASFYAHLYYFLITLPGLERLELLLQGPVCLPPSRFMSILSRHGESLHCLILDERRSSWTISTYDASKGLHSPASLDFIAAKCPNLEVLGLGLSWPMITENHQLHDQVGIHLCYTTSWLEDI